MVQKLKVNLINNIKNIPGWSINRKILIIECDDWGGIRMPSKEVYEKLKLKGLKVDAGWHNKYDTLANNMDLEMLFNVLYSVKDRNGNPSVMTPIVNVANPDFSMIKSNGFKEYYYEPFTETLKRYYPNEEVFKTWRQGIDAGIFIPEFHGREHITVQLWLELLRKGNKDLLYAFDNEFVSLDVPDCPHQAKEFRPGFYLTSNKHIPFLINSIIEGTSLFKQVFRFSPSVFVPTNGVFHPQFDIEIAKSGMKFLWVNHINPYRKPDGKIGYRYSYSGKKGPLGIIYYTRNCAFEPNDPGYKGINNVLFQIESAFRWGKPAIISTHRANFVGGIEPSIRKKGLFELEKLLRLIVKKWPEVEFMSSVNALNLIKDYS